MAKSELHRDYILELENELAEFEKKADSSTKRLQILVYPAMVAFFILSAFGFYLIYSLTSDVNRMANTITHMTDSVDRNMSDISDSMDDMSVKMDNLVVSTTAMSGDLGSMTKNTIEMVNSINGMRFATYDMAASTNNMQRDIWSMNKNISTPLSAINKFLPWKNSSSMPFPGSRAPLPQTFFAYPTQQQPYLPNNVSGGVIPFPPLPQAGYAPVLPVPPAQTTPDSPLSEPQNETNKNPQGSAVFSPPFQASIGLAAND